MAKREGIQLLNIGFGNTVVADRVVAVVAPGSSPMKRLREEARVAGKLVDATHGRKTRAIVITDSDHVILSAIQAETVSQRLRGTGYVPIDGVADAPGDHTAPLGRRADAHANSVPNPSGPSSRPSPGVDS